MRNNGDGSYTFNFQNAFTVTGGFLHTFGISIDGGATWEDSDGISQTAGTGITFITDSGTTDANFWKISAPIDGFATNAPFAPQQGSIP